ncbi:hypothetical protein C2142_08905 [Streptomyces sp. CB01881]|nr:hypothetical protein C2142_08905 [Streptomyces sp. CB01881]
MRRAGWRAGPGGGRRPVRRGAPGRSRSRAWRRRGRTPCRPRRRSAAAGPESGGGCAGRTRGVGQRSP